MSDVQTIDNTPSGKLPSVEDFKSTVVRQLNSWSASTVEELCHSQTETLINDLAPYYHSGEKDAVPEVTDFKEVFSNFQQKHERVAFADLNDTEVSALIQEVAPLFHDSEDEEDESDETDEREENTDEGNLDKHPF